MWASYYWIIQDHLSFKGRFMGGMTNKNGDPYFGQLQLPTLDLERPGTFEVSYWVLIYCGREFCVNGQDSVKLLLNEGDAANSYVDSVSYNNIGTERMWIKRSFEYTTSSRYLDVSLG